MGIKYESVSLTCDVDDDELLAVETRGRDQIVFTGRDKFHDREITVFVSKADAKKFAEHILSLAN